jgi:hypothetical protein
LDRSAISRAYYGAFNVSRRWLEANVTPIDGLRAHAQVWETFRIAERASSGSRESWKAIGNLGDSMRELRNQADYDDIVPGLDGRAMGAVRDAERILALLPNLKFAD